MNEERWAQVERLYHSARERPAGERAAYVAEACGADAELLREVESLLAQDVTAIGPMDRPAWEGSASLLVDRASLELLPGVRLGPYQITGNLGEGGMGRVYSALDTRLGRSVAVKVSAAEFGEIQNRSTRGGRFESSEYLHTTRCRPKLPGDGIGGGGHAG